MEKEAGDGPFKKRDCAWEASNESFFTQDGRTVLATARSGVIHGPVLFVGSVPILPVNIHCK